MFNISKINQIKKNNWSVYYFKRPRFLNAYKKGQIIITQNESKEFEKYQFQMKLSPETFVDIKEKEKMEKNNDLFIKYDKNNNHKNFDNTNKNKNQDNICSIRNQKQISKKYPIQKVELLLSNINNSGLSQDNIKSKNITLDNSKNIISNYSPISSNDKYHNYNPQKIKKMKLCNKKKYLTIHSKSNHCLNYERHESLSRPHTSEVKTREKKNKFNKKQKQMKSGIQIEHEKDAESNSKKMKRYRQIKEKKCTNGIAANQDISDEGSVISSSDVVNSNFFISEEILKRKRPISASINSKLKLRKSVYEVNPQEFEKKYYKFLNDIEIKDLQY